MSSIVPEYAFTGGDRALPFGSGYVALSFQTGLSEIGCTHEAGGATHAILPVAPPPQKRKGLLLNPSGPRLSELFGLRILPTPQCFTSTTACRRS